MNPTKKAVLMRDLGTVVVNEVSNLQTFLIVSGVVFWFLVVLAVARFLVRRSEWFTEERVDIPTSMQREWNRGAKTAAMPFSEFRQTDGDAS